MSTFLRKGHIALIPRTSPIISSFQLGGTIKLLDLFGEMYFAIQNLSVKTMAFMRECIKFSRYLKPRKIKLN
jgi:hypothetical protein